MTTGELELPRTKVPTGAYILINNQVFPIAEESITIGRQLDNDLVINDSLVSRRHAQIQYKAHQFFLEDLGSTGGTFLNSRPINNSTPLHSGDIILIANIPIMFVIDMKAIGGSVNQQTRNLDE